ncbi:hypothetical protein ES703_121151 [subsurface metagenome]
MFTPAAIRRGAVILPPGDIISAVCRAEDVNIAVAVDVGGIDTIGDIKIFFYSVLGEVITAVIFPPSDVIVESCRSQDIKMTIVITLNISSIDTRSVFKASIYAVFGETLAAVILPPVDIIVTRSQDVYIAIAIDIDSADTPGGRKARCYSVFSPAAIRRGAVTLPPGDFIGVCCCAQDINITVAVNIGSIDRGSTIKISFYGVPTEVFIAVVLPPGDFISLKCCTEDINITITVNINGIYTPGVIKTVSDSVLVPQHVWRRRPQCCKAEFTSIHNYATSCLSPVVVSGIG